MARHLNPEFGEFDSVLFLALFWGGKPVCTLTDILWLCDWVNRAIPTAKELEGALNRLLAAGLVVESRGGFGIPRKVVRHFDRFRKRRRRNRFVMAEEFVRLTGPLEAVPHRVTIGRADHAKAYAEYSRLFDEAAKKLGL
jgi:hypothetical protein